MQDQENITPIDQHVIDFIRDLRVKKGVTQQGLADILGVSKSYISSIESTNSRAKYNLRYLNIIAEFFDLSPKDFLPARPVPFEFIREGKADIEKIDNTKKGSKTNKSNKRTK